jgi:hypothetical protein
MPRYKLRMLLIAASFGTPVSAKLTDKQWTIAEMIERTANYQKPEPSPPSWPDFLSTIPDEQ